MLNIKRQSLKSIVYTNCGLIRDKLVKNRLARGRLWVKSFNNVWFKVNYKQSLEIMFG